jgi:hypothetical protein
MQGEAGAYRKAVHGTLNQKSVREQAQLKLARLRKM